MSRLSLFPTPLSDLAPMARRAALFVVLFSLCLTHLPVASAQVLSSSAPSYPTITIPAGSVTQETTFTFSDANDGMACLSTDASYTTGFAASDGGDIYVWSLASRPSSLSPTYVDGTGSSGASFIACQANPSGTVLYLLDTRQLQLSSYTVSQSTTAPVIIASFPDEEIGSLTSLAIDFNASIAYIATRDTDNLYSVNITLTAQQPSALSANPLNSDVSALTLSTDYRTLYYAAPAPAQGVVGSINSLPVRSGVVPDSSSPTVIVQSLTLIWPVNLLINTSASILFIKDGGPFHGEAEPNEDPDAYQSVFRFPFNANTNASSPLPYLYRTNQLNLPSGLCFTADQQSLYFTATTTLNRLSLYPRVVPAPSSSSTFSSSSRASSSSPRPSSTAAPTSRPPTFSSTSTFSPLPTLGPGPTNNPLPTGVTSTPASVPSGSTVVVAGSTAVGEGGSSSSSGLSTGAIIGIAVGGFVVLLLACLALFCLMTYCRRGEPKQQGGRGRGGKNDESDGVEMPRGSNGYDGRVSNTYGY